MSKNNENKLVPKLRFPEFENENSWVEKTLGEVAEIITGNTPSTNQSEYYNGEKMFVSPADIDDKRYVNHTKTTLTELGFSKTRKIKANSVLFVCIGSTIGKVAQNKFECATNQQLNSIVPYDEYSSDFIYSLLEANANNISSLAGRQAVPIINKTLFSSVSLLFPTKSEQKKIAACLSSLDEVITAESQKLDLLQDHKRGLLQSLLPVGAETIPKFRFEEFQDSDEWVEDTLLNIASFRRGSFPQPYGLPEWYDDDNGMPFIQVFDVGEDFRLKPTTKNKISELAAKQSVFIQKGTLIITLQGSIGRVAITQYDAYIDRTLLLFEEFHKEIDLTFFAYTIFLLFEIEKQKAPGGIIKTITKEVLSSFVVKMPSVIEQRKIASCFSSLDELISSQTQKVEALKTHKKGLLQSLFPNVNKVVV
jgi:type I restriction enzyme S subunit